MAAGDDEQDLEAILARGNGAMRFMPEGDDEGVGLSIAITK